MTLNAPDVASQDPRTCFLWDERELVVLVIDQNRGLDEGQSGVPDGLPCGVLFVRRGLTLHLTQVTIQPMISYTLYGNLLSGQRGP